MTIEEIKERRRELGYTCEMLSQISGLPLETVQKVLGGVTKSPRHDTILALERALSMPQAETVLQAGMTAQDGSAGCALQDCVAGIDSNSCVLQDSGAGVGIGSGSCVPQDGRVWVDSGSCMPQDGAAVVNSGGCVPQDGAAVVDSGSCVPQDGAAVVNSGGCVLQDGVTGVYSDGCTSQDSRSADGGSVLREPAAGYSLRAAEQGKDTGAFKLEDYYALPEERRAELIDGKFYDMAAPTITHQILAGRIFACFLAHIDAGERKCLPLVSPVDVQLDQDDRTMVQPDVLILCDREKLRRNVIYGAPDLVVEILSKSTMTRDMIIKLNKYYQAGVREYWIVDPAARKIRVYQFAGEESSYQEYEATDAVPVGIWDGACRVDFGEIFAYLDSQGGLQE